MSRAKYAKVGLIWLSSSLRGEGMPQAGRGEGNIKRRGLSRVSDADS